MEMSNSGSQRKANIRLPLCTRRTMLGFIHDPPQDKSIDVYGREEEAVNKQIADLENI